MGMNCREYEITGLTLNFSDSITQMQKMDLFINTSYPEEVIIWGWSNARGTAK